MTSGLNNPPSGVIQALQATDTITSSDNAISSTGSGTYDIILNVASACTFFGGVLTPETGGGGGSLKYTIDGTAKTISVVNVASKKIVLLPPAYAKTSLKIEFACTTAQTTDYSVVYK